MNLFFSPSVEELRTLLENAPASNDVHDVVLDYDGEVLIDPQKDQPHLDLNKFKFRMQLTELSKRALEMGSAPLRYIYTNLLRAWNSENDFRDATFA